MSNDQHPYASSSSSTFDPSYPNSHLNPPLITATDSYLNLDEDDDVFDPQSIDPDLRLRTVRTAHSVIVESVRAEAHAERRMKRRRLFQTMKRKASFAPMRKSKTLSESGESDTMKSRRVTVDTIDTDFGSASNSGSISKRPSVTLPPQSPKSDSTPPSQPLSFFDRISGKGKAKAEPRRRSVFVNLPLPSHLIATSGEPLIRYVRNKVRTSKYTLITFIPKNLFEQFRRVANIYFLFLVIIQLFSIFGAPNAQIGMLPLLAILGMTAIKDGIEDWRRATLDNEVNNAATTKLGGWRNVNQPKDPRPFFERLFNIGPAPGQTTKGVRKLREREASAGNQIVMDSQKAIEEGEELHDVVVVDKHSYPLENIPTFAISEAPYEPDVNVPHRYSLPLRKSTSTASMMSRRSVGVLDWSRPSSGSARWERTLWKKLEVGDLVLLRDNEQVPADIIVLSTSNADNLCFVETKNLDGETNLKIRRGLKATASISSEEDLEHARFIIDSEPPHANLYSYNGVLKYTPADGDSKSGEERSDGITINEMLLRGCALRNTKWVIGMVVFTGADTKIMLNGGETPSKRSKIEKETNFNVIMNFVVLVVLCLATALLHGYYRSITGTSADYYEHDSEASDNIYLDSLIIFVSALLVFQNIVPISLYITVEIVKTIQAYFIFQDLEMYYEPYDTPCVPKTWNISDDLGQIEYVFSDKTGTLTQNIMEFKKCSINGVSFGEGLTEAMMGAAKRDGQDLGPAMASQDEELQVLKKKMVDTMKHTINNRYLREDKLTLIAPDLAERMANSSDPLRPFIMSFFRALAICHSVLSDTPDTSKPYEIDYKAESPDEAALVAAARDVGFPFINKNTNYIDIEVLGATERWTPLRMLEFNSSRKRMSVIARAPDGRIILYCKGADSIIYSRLDRNHDEDLKQATMRDMEAYANGGLRTLCISYRYLSEEEYTDWAKKYDAACAATVDRDGEIEKASELIEHSLIILGATALEDKLQEGVPDAIATLHKAGIKLWILTGDKLQTAIEIGYSCNLLTNDMEVMIISADSEDGARAQIEAGLNKIASVIGPPPMTKHGKIINPGMNSLATFAVVIDGDSLRHALQPSLKPLFLSLGTQCSAVICCRVSPSQKALTVRLVKEGCNAMTLAIGDGANDVAMIQEANIGVGLYGLEGSQAAMSADYAFGQFRFLTRLLLVHGRWSYVRVADMHANFFYKNAIFTIAVFWFYIFSGFDATYLYEYTFILLFNLVFTSLPVGVLGAFDQDLNAKAALAFPQLYKRGIRGLEYTRTRFWLYMADGLYQSAIIFFIPFLATRGGETWSSSGRDTNFLYDLGTTSAAAGVLSANSYIGINSRYWSIMTVVVEIASTLLIFLWIPIYSALAALPYAGEVTVIYPTFSFWAIVLMTTFVAVGPRWLVKSFKTSYIPKDKDIVREAWITGSLKRELGVKRRRDSNRQDVNLEMAGNISPTSRSIRAESVISHFKDTYYGGSESTTDERGTYSYEPAAMFSPQKDYSRSPVISGPASEVGEGTPRSVFSYPPQSPAIHRQLASASPSPVKGTVPPPLLLRQSSDPGIPSPLGLGFTSSSHLDPGSGIGSGNGDGRFSRVLETPVSRLEYTSPSAIETFQQTSEEIKRLSRASIEIKRASLDGSGVLNDVSPIRRSSNSRGSSTKRKSLPMSMGFSSPPSSASAGMSGHHLKTGGLEVPGQGLSPVRGSCDTDADDEHRDVFETDYTLSPNTNQNQSKNFGTAI